MPRPTLSLNKAAINKPSLDAHTIESLRISSFNGMSDAEIAKLSAVNGISLAWLLNEIIHTYWLTIADRPALSKSEQEGPSQEARAAINRVSRTALDLAVELTKLPTGSAPMPRVDWRLKDLIPSYGHNATRLGYFIYSLVNDDPIAASFFPDTDDVGLHVSADSENPQAIAKVVKRARSLAKRLGELADEAEMFDVEDVQELESAASQFVDDADATLIALSESGDVMRSGHQPTAIRREILITELYALRLMLTERRDRYSKVDRLGGPFGILATTVVAAVEGVEFDPSHSNSLGDRIRAAADAVDAVTESYLTEPFVWWDSYHELRRKALGLLRND